MDNYVLSCCSTADLSAEHFAARGIVYLCFHYLLNGKQFEDDLGKSMSFDAFYRAMAEGATTATSQPNVDEFIEYFTPILASGKDVLHVCLSSGLSGVYNSACIAAADLREKFPERRLRVIDSLGASSGYGLIMETLADKRDAGCGFDELADWAEANRLRMHHWFISTDLSYYVRGGRITKAEGWFGTILKICPVLNMDNLGRLIPRYKTRGKSKALQSMADEMARHAQGGTGYSGKCFISNSGCFADARTVADLVEARFPKLDGRVVINSVGTTIGSHTGPGTVALFFWGDPREN